MLTAPKFNQNDDSSDVTDQTVDFPFSMQPPSFGVLPENIDGTVLYLNALEPDANNTVILKGGMDEGVIHLVIDTELVKSGIIDAHSAFTSADFIGFYYYLFQNDLQLISEQALVILT